MTETSDDLHDKRWLQTHGLKAIGVAEGIAKEAALSDAESVRYLLKHDSGLRFLHWLLGPEACDVMGRSFSPSAPQTTEHNEGLRAAGLKVIERIEQVDPRGYIAVLEWGLNSRLQREQEMKNVGKD